MIAPARALLACSFLLGTAAAQEGARAEGNRLREALGKAGVRPELAGAVRLQVRLGELVVGSLVLETQVVAREDGEQVYRVQDRLTLDLPGQGSAHMALAADLRADLSTVEARLTSEEPRGPGGGTQGTVTVFRREGRWVRRSEPRGRPPVEEVLPEDLPADALLLAPPLGAGERLARLVPAQLGLRLSVRALDLETGQGATWRCSVEDEPGLATQAGDSRPGLYLVREEGGAALETWREREPGGAPWKLVGGRLVHSRAELARVDPEPPGPARALLRVLRAAAARDREALAAGLDLPALLAAAVAAAGAAPPPEVQARLGEALLDRLTDPEWLSRTGLQLAVEGARARDLEVTLEAGPPARARVTPAGQAGLAFRLEEREGVWKIVDLPR